MVAEHSGYLYGQSERMTDIQYALSPQNFLTVRTYNIEAAKFSILVDASSNQTVVCLCFH